MSVAEKPGVLERLGGAMNTSDLSPREGQIGAVELLGALAYTQINPDAAKHSEVDAAVIDPRTRLASVLVRLKYGGDRVLGERAVLLLGHWVRHQKAFGRWKMRQGSDDLLTRFVRQGLAEWLYPVCEECAGRELVGMDKGEIVEKRVRCTRCRSSGVVHVSSQGKYLKTQVRQQCPSCGGSGWRTYRRVRQTKTRECHICLGTGRRRANDAERAHAMRMEHKVYQRHWLRRFDWLAAGLDRLDQLQRFCLQSQMKPGINADLK